MKTLRMLVLAVALGLLPASPSRADDSSDARSTIQRQLDAFRAGDAGSAYGLAAPNIRGMFPTPDIFMRMVETGYPPVFRSRAATFGGLKPEGGGLRQEVYLSDADGKSWIASYTLARQADGSLKITGCSLREGFDIGA